MAKIYIDTDEYRDEFYQDVLTILSADDTNDRANEIIDVFDNLPAADVAPVVHGSIVWKKRHKGGFITRKCLSDCGNSIFTSSCNKIAKIDDRCTVSLPYCSVCGKLLGDFLNYCPNCGARMDGDENDP